MQKVPPPTNVTQLKSFLGMVNFYSKFVPRFSTTLAPLYELLKGDVKFIWSVDCQRAFESIKKHLLSDNVLVHYDATKPIKLTVDASAKGIGAVLSHTFPNKSERPIAFASRVLSQAEKSYSQIQKEALAIIYAVKKFNQYLVDLLQL